MKNRTKEDFNLTTNSTVYKKELKLWREQQDEIDCAWCPYHKIDNFKKTKDKRNWKRYRKTQYRVKVA